MDDAKNALPGQCILMLAVALDELRATEAEPDLAKVRIRIASVENTLKDCWSLPKQWHNLDPSQSLVRSRHLSYRAAEGLGLTPRGEKRPPDFSDGLFGSIKVRPYQATAFLLTPFRRASVLSLVFVAFSSLRFVVLFA